MRGEADGGDAQVGGGLGEGGLRVVGTGCHCFGRVDAGSAQCQVLVVLLHVELRSIQGCRAQEHLNPRD